MTDGRASTPASSTGTSAAEAPEPRAESAPEYRASETMIRDALSEVYDPEIGIDIVALGLVYGIALDEAGILTIDMTLTSPYCPMGGLIQDQVAGICGPLPGVESVKVNFVFTPPWDPRTMASDEAKLDLGIY